MVSGPIVRGLLARVRIPMGRAPGSRFKITICGKPGSRFRIPKGGDLELRLGSYGQGSCCYVYGSNLYGSCS